MNGRLAAWSARPIRRFHLQTEPQQFVLTATAATARLAGSFGFNAFGRALKPRRSAR